MAQEFRACAIIAQFVTHPPQHTTQSESVNTKNQTIYHTSRMNHNKKRMLQKSDLNQ